MTVLGYELPKTNPASVAFVSYANLSRDVASAEKQKDALTYFMREHFKSVSSFVEIAESDVSFFQSVNQDFFPVMSIKISCDSCDASSMEDSFNVNVVEIKKAQKNYEGIFKIVSRKNIQYEKIWKVKFASEPMRYFVASKTEIALDEKLKDKSLQVFPCFYSLHCNVNNSFADVTLAENHLNKLQKMVAKKNLAARQPIFFTDAIIPVLIKQNEIVKVRLMVNGLQISTHGRSLSAGVQGQLLSVELEPPGSFFNHADKTTTVKKHVYAKVVGVREVEIAD